MKKQILYLLCSSMLCADNLKELIEYAKIHNNLVHAHALTAQSKQEALQASQATQMPTVDIGAMYQRLDDRTITIPGDIYNTYAKISYDIYDGNRKSSIIEQKQNEFHATEFEAEAFKKSLALQIVQDFFGIKNIEETIKALEEKKIALEAELKRVKKFYQADLSTQDDVDKLQSAYDTNLYNIHSLRFQRLSTLKSLGLKVGKEIDELDPALFTKTTLPTIQTNDTVKSLQFKEDSLKSLAKSMESAYLPQVNISDTYNLNEYGRTDATHPEGLPTQNKLMLNVNLRVFDGGTNEKNKQATLINAQALNAQRQEAKASQKIGFELSLSKIKTEQLKIQSALSALHAAQSTYETIKEKYKAGVVDNVVYLDALSGQTNALSLYKKSLNDLEVAYASYYYYAGKEIEEFIK